jgi:hypothetical protein
MAASSLRDSQMTMARYLRDPGVNPPPQGVERRRLKIYEDLVYNNIEGFISGGFPVLRSLYCDDNWHEMVRCFIDNHRCHSPYFLEISQEYIQFLMEDYQLGASDPVFMVELAHYEWAELALDVSEEELPPPHESLEISGTSIVRLSPVAWVLSYRFPVHRIGPGFQPTEATEPTYLAVYRDRQDSVQFMELNSATARLLELVRDNDGQALSVLLDQLAQELGIAPEALQASGLQQVQEFSERSIII